MHSLHAYHADSWKAVLVDDVLKSPQVAFVGFGRVEAQRFSVCVVALQRIHPMLARILILLLHKQQIPLQRGPANGSYILWFRPA